MLNPEPELAQKHDDIVHLQKELSHNKQFLSIASDIVQIRTKKELLNLINTKLQNLFHFSYSVSIQLSDDLQQFTTFLLDPRSHGKANPDYDEIVSRRYPVNDGMFDRILQSQLPILINLEEEAGKPDTAPYITMGHSAGLKECVGVTLRNRDHHPIGIILFVADNRGFFGTSTLHIIKEISYYLAAAMTNIIYHEDISRRDKESGMLLTISHAIASIRDKKELIYVIQQAMKSCLNFSDIAITHFNMDKGTFKVFLEHCETSNLHPDFNVIAFSEYPIADGLHDVIMHSESAIVLSLQELIRSGFVHFNFIYNAGIKEVAGVRLQHNNEIIGAMTLLSPHKNSFQTDDLVLIKKVSHHLSATLASVLAHEAIQKSNKEKSALLSFSNNLSSVRERKDLATVISNHLKDLMYYDDFVIYSCDHKNQTIQAFVFGHAEDPLKNLQHNKATGAAHPLADELFNLVLGSEGPLAVDMEQLIKQEKATPYVISDYEFGAGNMIAAPLRKGKKTIGVFCLLLSDKDLFPKESFTLLQGVSYQLSTAMANILANERIERQLKEISDYKEKIEEEKLYLQEEAGIGYTYSDIIGSGKEMQKVFLMLSQVSFAQSSVLLLGETGTGKELIARAIHNSSPRNNKLMVKVNCAALPANLIESELFGHERGSFTGAHERRIGKFELANHGTLFLDEIGEMPLDLQVKLLRAIQEKEIERVGGKAVIKIDVRIIAATNRVLQKEVNEGRFRADLFYRLNVFPITLPPLRDRKEDIPVLATHFIDRFAKNAGKKNMRISSMAMKQLVGYNWPGNVRELEHLIERSVLLNQGNVIREIHLPSFAKEEPKGDFNEGYTKTLEELERAHIIAVLKNCRGKIYGTGGAAEVLGLHVSTLNHRIKKLGIRKEQVFLFKK